jgi:hypothetical protein
MEYQMVFRDVQLVGFRNRLVSTPQNNDCLSFPISFFLGGGKQYGELWGNSGKTLGNPWENVRTFQFCLCINVRASNLLFLVKFKNNYGKFRDLQ